MIAYGFTIFTGAFLLFQVQPLIGKYLLPWFGGAPGVWTTCMLFFQVVLLGGYAYAHLSSRVLKPRAQVLVHLFLLAVALVMLPVIPDASWKPHTAANPTLRILALLGVCVGLPYFVLSATAPLLQHWFSRTSPGVSPFRLYALSNTGSLLALLSYPTLVENWFTRSTQANVWGVGLGAYALGCAWCGRRVWHSGAGVPEGGSGSPAPAVRPSPGQKLLWLGLPACASVLLLAVTNKICQDVAVMAFLWILPLALYLLSFIICFDRPRWYRRWGFGLALLAALAMMSWTLADRLALSVPLQILVYTAGLFVCCMVCHGEVYRLKPDPAYLTSFYLMIAAGGALGGVFVAVIAPAIFSDYFELHWGILLCGGLFLGLWIRDRRSSPAKPWARVAWAASALALMGLGFLLWGAAHKLDRACVYRARNFYGVLRVCKYAYGDPRLNLVELVHGRIAHGMQYLHESRAGQPTLYYSSGTGIGRAFGTLQPGNRHVGIVGLGAGTVAAYAQAGDKFRFYEINPEVETVARRDFSYLKNAHGEMTVVLGDARLSLEQEPPQQFDLLILDAFNSDAIPIHLLTREAFAAYQRHLKTNGVIAVHISNASINLEPVVLSAARQFGYTAASIHNAGTDTRNGVLPSSWMVLSQNRGVMEAAAIREAARPAAQAAVPVPLWTDDFSGLFPVLRWEHFFGTAPKAREQYVQIAAVVKPNQVANVIAERREEVRRDPTSATALNNLACLLATAPDPALRDGAEAVRLAERACAATEHRNTVMLTTLAAAYAEAGRFEEAVVTAEKACTLATERHEQTLLQRNRELLEYYRRKEAYHQAGP